MSEAFGIIASDQEIWCRIAKHGIGMATKRISNKRDGPVLVHPCEPCCFQQTHFAEEVRMFASGPGHSLRLIRLNAHILAIVEAATSLAA